MLKGKGLLSAGQRRFLRLFSKTPDSTHFYLTGGTALAEFYLGHRYSFDLDLFTGEPALNPARAIMLNPREIAPNSPRIAPSPLDKRRKNVLYYACHRGNSRMTP
jgi:hypothetical protein